MMWAELETCQVEQRTGFGNNETVTLVDVDNRGAYQYGYNLGLGKCKKYPVILRGKALSTWEHARTWSVGPYLDLRPWLRQGTNTISILLVVGGKGEFWMNVRERRTECGEELQIPEAYQPPLGGTAGGVKQELVDQIQN